MRRRLSRVLIAISGIAIVLASARLSLGLEDLIEANEHALLLPLPVTADQCPWVRGAMR